MNEKNFKKPKRMGFTDAFRIPVKEPKQTHCTHTIISPIMETKNSAWSLYDWQFCLRPPQNMFSFEFCSVANHYLMLRCIGKVTRQLKPNPNMVNMLELVTAVYYFCFVYFSVYVFFFVFSLFCS